MKNYTKPTFMLASLGIRASAAIATSCDYKITVEDREFFDLWAPGWEENGFHSEENCSIPIDQYCKFSAGSNESLGVVNAFIS